MPYNKYFILFLIIFFESKSNKESLFSALFCKSVKNTYICFENEWYQIPNYAIENANSYQMMSKLPLHEYHVTKKDNEVIIVDRGFSQEIGKFLRLFRMIYAPFIYMGMGDKLTAQDYQNVIKNIKFYNNIIIKLKHCPNKRALFSTPFEDDSLLSEDKRLKNNYLHDSVQSPQQINSELTHNQNKNYIFSKKTTETKISPLKIILFAGSIVITALALKKARTMKEFFHILERWIIGHPGQPSSIKLSAEGRTRLT